MTHPLTISGSLRTGSSNGALLSAAALPAFLPDLDAADEPAPAAVTHWRTALVPGATARRA